MILVTFCMYLCGQSFWTELKKIACNSFTTILNKPKLIFFLRHLNCKSLIQGLIALKFKSDYLRILEHAHVRQPLQALRSKSHCATFRIISFCHSRKHKKAGKVQAFKQTLEFLLCKVILTIENSYATKQICTFKKYIILLFNETEKKSPNLRFYLLDKL